jgi:hypothetical protein
VEQFVLATNRNPELAGEPKPPTKVVPKADTRSEEAPRKAPEKEPKKPELTLAPNVLDFGNVSRGQQLVRVILRGPEEFRIKELRTSDSRIHVVQEGTARVTILTVTFDARKVGALNGKVHVITDLAAGGEVVLQLVGQVVP